MANSLLFIFFVSRPKHISQLAGHKFDGLRSSVQQVASFASE